MHMPKIYLGGTFHPFTPEHILARQDDLERRLDPSIRVLKPLPKDLYPTDLGPQRDQTLTERDRYMVRHQTLLYLITPNVGWPHRAAFSLKPAGPPRGISRFY